MFWVWGSKNTVNISSFPIRVSLVRCSSFLSLPQHLIPLSLVDAIGTTLRIHGSSSDSSVLEVTTFYWEDLDLLLAILREMTVSVQPEEPPEGLGKPSQNFHRPSRTTSNTWSVCNSHATELPHELHLLLPTKLCPPRPLQCHSMRKRLFCPLFLAQSWAHSRLPINIWWTELKLWNDLVTLNFLVVWLFCTHLSKTNELSTRKPIISVGGKTSQKVPYISPIQKPKSLGCF